MKKPNIAGKAPKMESIEASKTYAWCACGKSSNLSWCDGSHQGSDFSPTIFKAEEDKTAAICLCKHTKNPPYCDGSHNNL